MVLWAGGLPRFAIGFFEAVNPVLLNLAGGDFREAQGAEERHQVHRRPPVLAFDVDLAALALRDDVVFAQVLVRGFAEGFFCFDFAGAELAAKLQIPVLGDLFGFGEAVFLRACPAVLPGEVGGALPAAAVRAFVNVNFAAQDCVLFRHGRVLSERLQSTKMCKLCASRLN